MRWRSLRIALTTSSGQAVDSPPVPPSPRPPVPSSPRPPVPSSPMPSKIDFSSDTYRDAYSRINGIVIVGEQEAHDNFMRLAELLPNHYQDLVRLGKIEASHKKSFQACGNNLNVTPDLDFAHRFFADLHQIFQTAADAKKIATCLVVQSLIIECFAIAAYNSYIPVADDFARKITESVVNDEYSHLNFGEVWLRESFEQYREEIVTANRQVMPTIWQMLDRVEVDLATVGMTKVTVVEDFSTRYGDALSHIGFSLTDIMRIIAGGMKSETIEIA